MMDDDCFLSRLANAAVEDSAPGTLLAKPVADSNMSLKVDGWSAEAFEHSGFVSGRVDKCIVKAIVKHEYIGAKGENIRRPQMQKGRLRP